MSLTFFHQQVQFDMCFISVGQFQVSQQQENQIFKETLMERGQ